MQYHREAYTTTEWVYNEAEIDRARIVWVQDMGPTMNEEVLRYYPDRKAWFVNVDDAPYRLLPYAPDLARLISCPFDKESVRGAARGSALQTPEVACVLVDGGKAHGQFQQRFSE